MRENYRKYIESIKKFPQFTTMHVIDGQDGLIICASLIFCSLTIDNILNIIVLLILAGISISILSGENGILQRATDSKTRTERQSIIEQARIDILGYQAENKGGDLDKTQLKTVLDKYFDEVPDLANMEKNAILNTELHTLAKYGTHTIAVYEIYSGNIKSNNVQTIINFRISDDFYQNGPWDLSCIEGTTWEEWAEATLAEPIYTDSSGHFIYYEGSLQELILEAKDGSNGWPKITQGSVSIQGSGWDFTLKTSDGSRTVAPTDKITAQNYKFDGYED